jgi:hypothetical protein
MKFVAILFAAFLGASTVAAAGSKTRCEWIDAGVANKMCDNSGGWRV